MKIKTQYTTTKEIEVEVDPIQVLSNLLDNALSRVWVQRKDGYDKSYAYINSNLDLIAVNFKEGIGYGHYERDDEFHREIITDKVDSQLYDKICSFKKSLMHLQAV